jgi:hypothetical protein
VCWRNADLIQRDYELPNYRTVYRHARATGLFQRRRENLRFAAELLIERADQAKPSPGAILRAVGICARISAHGNWVEPAKHVIFSSSSNVKVTERATRSDPTFRPQSTFQQEPVSRSE